MDLLAAEITARTGKDPGEHYRELTAEFGTPYYTRIDAPATPEQKAQLSKLSPEAVKATDLAGEPITAKLTRAPGNNAPIGGLKVVAASGWFAARPSGTENIYKIYAESFKDEAHLNAIVSEAQAIVNSALNVREADSDRSADSAIVLRFRPDTAPPGCCCTSLAAIAVTALATWGRPHWRGSIACTRPAKAGGRHCRSVHTGYGNSPYQSLSSFAGNGLLISPDWLIEDGLLRAGDCRGSVFPAAPIDYDAVIPFKPGCSSTAWTNFGAGARSDLRPRLRAVLP